MGCLNVKVTHTIKPIKVIVTTDVIVKPTVTLDSEHPDISIKIINETINPSIIPVITKMVCSTQLRRTFNMRCSLVCATTIVRGIKYVFVEPKYLWLTNSELLDADVVITSNTNWNIN